MSSADAVKLFRTSFHTEPSGVWSAPGRVNLIGEHTDYNGGLVLPFAIPHRTFAAVGPVDAPGLHLISAQIEGAPITLDMSDIVPAAIDGWSAYVAGVVWVLGLADTTGDHAAQGLAIAVDSNVPLGSGLSSSAALMCSVGLALTELFDLDHDRPHLAALTQTVENDFVGAPTGGMDQRASLLCEEGHALRFDVLADTTELVPFVPDLADLTVLVVDTRVAHAHVDGGYAARRADCETAAATLGIDVLRQLDLAMLEASRPMFSALADGGRIYRRARHVVTENQRVDAVCRALDESRWQEVGELMTAAHISIRDDFEVSCPELDTAVETLVDAGALGARMTGGGFGGSAIGLVPHNRLDAAIEAVERTFSDAGFAAPSCFVVSPSAGAQRDL